MTLDICQACAAGAHGNCFNAARGAERYCDCDCANPTPLGNRPSRTGTPMKTHAACLPGEGCRVEPGMRFEAAMRFMVEGVKTMPADIAARFAIEHADALLAELGKP